MGKHKYTPTLVALYGRAPCGRWVTIMRYGATSVEKFRRGLLATPLKGDNTVALLAGIVIEEDEPFLGYNVFRAEVWA